MKSVLVKKQTKGYCREYRQDGIRHRIKVELRFDDECGNGHNTFAITADIRQARGGHWREYMGGRCHDEIARRFPRFAPIIKWHGCTTEGPLHYIANTLYHVKQCGPQKGWIYRDKECIEYVNVDEVDAILARCPDMEFEPDEKTAKQANFDHARSTAIWPEATDADLQAPDLEQRLLDRLPGLMVDFKKAMESLGFEY